jgi:hypothetical protein
MDRLPLIQPLSAIREGQEWPNLRKPRVPASAWFFVPSYFSHGYPFDAPSHSEPCTPA